MMLKGQAMISKNLQFVMPLPENGRDGVPEVEKTKVKVRSR